MPHVGPGWKVGQYKHIVAARHIVLIIRQALLQHPTTTIGTTRGNDTTHDEENVPEQKSHKFVGIIGRPLLVGLTPTIVSWCIRAILILQYSVRHIETLQ
jgi:hypothetical protein